MMFAIETKGLVKSFGSFRAVDGLELKVPEGSVYGFLGPNGAGKTTTIKMLTGLSRPTAGEIRICGKEVRFGSLKNREEIGYLPDVPSFYGWMTPVEYLSFIGELFGLVGGTLKKRIADLLELVGLSDASKKRTGGFSRGMKQRLGIAQALINQPKVLLLDEPTSALDPIGRKEVIDIVSRLAGKMTVFFSTHILADVERVCDRVVILNRGKAVAEDSLANLRKKYSLKAIHLEVDAKDEGVSALAEDIKGAEWTEAVKQGVEGEIRVYANDIDRAQREIPTLLSQRGLALRKFELLEPSLEDIFLKEVNHR